MNDKDKEAFEKSLHVVQNKSNDYQRWQAIWQAACEYKRKEYSNIMDAMTRTSQNNAKLQAKNADLRIELEQWKAAAMAESEVNEKLQAEKAKLRAVVNCLASADAEAIGATQIYINNAKRVLKELEEK